MADLSGIPAHQAHRALVHRRLRDRHGARVLGALPGAEPAPCRPHVLGADGSDPGDRNSPFSLWDWGQYHAAGIPALSWLQKALDAVVIGGAIVLAVVPRKKTPLQLAALTAALLIGFEVVLTHWFYLYLPWFFGFVAYAVLAGELRAAEATVAAQDEHQTRELVPAG